MALFYATEEEWIAAGRPAGAKWGARTTDTGLSTNQEDPNAAARLAAWQAEQKIITDAESARLKTEQDIYDAEQAEIKRLAKIETEKDIATATAAAKAITDAQTAATAAATEAQRIATEKAAQEATALATQQAADEAAKIAAAEAARVAQAMADKAAADAKTAEEKQAAMALQAEADRKAAFARSLEITGKIGTEATGMISEIEARTESERKAIQELTAGYMAPADVTARTAAETAKVNAETEQALLKANEATRSEAAQRGGLYGGGYLGAVGEANVTAELHKVTRLANFQETLATEKKSREEFGISTVIDLYKTHAAQVQTSYQTAYNIAIEKAKMAQTANNADEQLAWEMMSTNINNAFLKAQGSAQISAQKEIEWQKQTSAEKMQAVQVTAQKLISGKEIASAEEMQRLRITAQDIITGKQIASNEQIATLRLAAEKDMHATDAYWKNILSLRDGLQRELERAFQAGENAKANALKLQIATMEADAAGAKAKAEGSASLWKGLFKIVAIGASLIPGVGPIASTALQTAAIAA